MGSWRKMGSFLGLTPADDIDDIDDVDSEQRGARTAYRPYREDYAPLRPRRDVTPSMTQSAGAMVDGALAVQMTPEPAPVPESGAAARPVTVKLTGFGEARVIGERYRDGASVILDMTDLTDDDARRVVDFAAGLAFAMRGSIDKVTARVFMLLPPNADVSAAQRRAFADTGRRR